MRASCSAPDTALAARDRLWLDEHEHDDVGNTIQRSGAEVPGGVQYISYSAFDLPTRIASPSSTVDFAYDAAGTRVIKQSATATTFYAGAYQRTVSGSNVNEQVQIYAGGRAVAQVSTDNVGTIATTSTRYLHEDLLGSVNAISNDVGVATTSRSYTPFGQATNASEVRYGFTGHEADDDLGLINMQGRMYDPRLGQFLSADPYMQQPYSQGLNRFAYVNNSPLNFTDPSGFIAKRGANGRAGISGLAAVWGGGTAIAAGMALSNLAAGPTAGVAMGGAGLGAAGAASAPATLAYHTPVSGTATAAAGIGSILTNQSLGQRLPTSAGGAEAPRSGGGRTGAAQGRGAVAPDATAPVQERTMAAPQVQEGGFAPQGAAPNAGASPQAPFVKDGRITDAGRNILRRTFDRYNFNVDQIKVIFKKNLGQAGITLGNRVYLDDSFQYRRPYDQMTLLAHEITHSVQYRDLGKANFLERYAVGYRQPGNYDVPVELWAVPTNKLSVTQTGSYLGPDGMRYDFTLDQIAERIGIETAAGLPYP